MKPSATTPRGPSNPDSNVEELIRLVGSRAMDRLKEEVSSGRFPTQGVQNPQINSVETEEGSERLESIRRLKVRQLSKALRDQTRRSSK
jgi:hypothetical protein